MNSLKTYHQNMIQNILTLKQNMGLNDPYLPYQNDLPKYDETFLI
jgi:hypothetical protein